MKKHTYGIISTCILILSVIFVTIITYNNSLANEEKSCWKELKTASKVFQKTMKSQFENDLGYLRILGKDMSNSSEEDVYQAYMEKIQTFQKTSLFERIDLLKSDNTLYSIDGNEQTVREGQFLTLNVASEYMDLVHTDALTQKKVINYYVPIKVDHVVSAYLVGVIDCDSLAKTFTTDLFDGKTQNIIVDVTDGQFVMSNQKMTFTNLDEISDFSLLRKYKNVDVIGEMEQLKTGVVAFSMNGTTKYLAYRPMKIYNWELIMIVDEDVAFADVITLKKNYIGMVVFEVVTLVLYCTYHVSKTKSIAKHSKEIEHQLDMSKTLIECIRQISDTNLQENAIPSILKIICEYFDADRAYLFDLDMAEKKVNAMYEYKLDFMPSVKEVLDHGVGRIEVVNAFLRNNSYYFHDIYKQLSKKSSICADLLKQNVHSMIVIPFQDEHNLNGLLGVDNPKQNYLDHELEESLCFFLKTALHNEKERMTLQGLSYIDTLTHVYNRNCYNEFIEKNKKRLFHNLGIIFFDLNGLKKVNDELGHIAGDTIITMAAFVMEEVFPKHTYRIGGDEFVVLKENVDSVEFKEQCNLVLERLKNCDISISFGYVWQETCSDLVGLLKDADQKMYINKKDYYSMSEHDRRKR